MQKLFSYEISLRNPWDSGLQELQVGEDLLQHHPVMRLDPPFQGFLQLRQFAAQASPG
jgi:hypothetical protein